MKAGEQEKAFHKKLHRNHNSNIIQFVEVTEKESIKLGKFKGKLSYSEVI